MSSGIVKSPIRDGERLHKPSFIPPEKTAAPPSSAADAAAVERQRLADEQARSRALAAELEALRERARQEGLALGREQAAAEAKASVAAVLSQVKNLMAAIQQAYDKDRAQAQSLLGDLVFVAVNRLLGECLRDRRMALASVEATLRSCGAWQDLTVEVHPDDVPVLDAAREGLPQAAVREIRVVASPEVGLGGCRVSGASGTVDARFETQLADLRVALQDARQSWAGSGT